MKKTALLIACAGLMIAGIGLAAPKPAAAGINISFGLRGYGYGNPGYGYGNPGYGSAAPGYGYGNPGYGYGLNGGFNNFSPGWGHGRNCCCGDCCGRGRSNSYPPVVVPRGPRLNTIPGLYNGYNNGYNGGYPY